MFLVEVVEDLLLQVRRRGRHRQARCRRPPRRLAFGVPTVLGVVRQAPVVELLRWTAPVVVVVAACVVVVMVCVPLAAVWLAVFRCRLFSVVAVFGVAVEAKEQGLPVAALHSEQGLPVAVPPTLVALHARLRTAQCRTLLREESAAHVQMVCSVDVVSPPFLVGPIVFARPFCDFWRL